MARSFLDSVLRGAEALAARDPVGALPDADLLRRFTTHRDQTAFSVLVRRHGPLVWGVCRNLLPADADAEDAFQATFLALVRSAGTVRKAEALGGWLHGVAYRVAMKARRAAGRRKRREAKAAVPEPAVPVADAAWDDLQAAVHEEVCRLPDKLRLPFVLCHLQGRPQKDAAAQLGWPAGTLTARLTQARRRLLDRLTRRGLPVAVAAGAAGLGTGVGAVVPSSLVAKAAAVAAAPETVSPLVVSLARGVTNMYLTRTKLLAAGLLVAGLLTTGVGTRLRSTADAQPPPNRAAESDTVKKALDMIRESPARDRWEYKFVPLDKPVSAADLQKLLSAADKDGWEFCGSQELLPPEQAKDPKAGGSVVSHLVFKRLRGVVKTDVRDTDAEAVRRLEAANLRAAEREAQARAADQAAAARALADELKQELQLARDREEALRARLKALEADAARRSAPPAGGAGTSAPSTPAGPGAKGSGHPVPGGPGVPGEGTSFNPPAGGSPVAPAPSRGTGPGGLPAGPSATSDPNLVRLELKHVKASDAVKDLAKVLPGVKVAAVDERTNTIFLVAPRESASKLQDLAAQLDRPADRSDIAVIKLQKASAEEVAKVLPKLLGEGRARYTVDATTNSLIVNGPPDVVADVKKLVTELDAVRGPAK